MNTKMYNKVAKLEKDIAKLYFENGYIPQAVPHIVDAYVLAGHATLEQDMFESNIIQLLKNVQSTGVNISDSVIAAVNSLYRKPEDVYAPTNVVRDLITVFEEGFKL